MKIRGISLRAHPSWFLVFLYFTLSAKDQFETLFEGQPSIWNGWLIGLITSLLLFTSVLLHELAHCFVAIGEGLKVKDITLFFLGGMANLEKECSTSKGSLKIAISGPFVSLLLAILMIFLSNILLESSLIFSNLFKQVGSLNLLIGLFNLLPIIPLDGGVILKSLIWYITGSKRLGMKIAIKCARSFSFIAIFFSLIFFINSSFYIAFSLLLIGLFIFSSSKSQAQIIKIQKILFESNVSQACRRSLRVLEDDLPIRALSKYSLINKEISSFEDFIFLCREGRWQGYLSSNILKNIPVQNWDERFLCDFSRPIHELPSIGEKESLCMSIIKIEEAKVSNLLVLSVAGFPIGTLSRADIGMIVLKKIGLNLPDKLIKIARQENIYPIGLDLYSIARSMDYSSLNDDQI